MFPSNSGIYWFKSYIFRTFDRVDRELSERKFRSEYLDLSWANWSAVDGFSISILEGILDFSRNKFFNLKNSINLYFLDLKEMHVFFKNEVNIFK